VPTTPLVNLRTKVAKKLYSPRYPVTSVTTSAGTTTALNDTILAAAGQSEEFHRAWLARTATIAKTQVDSGVNTNEALDATETGVDYTGSDVFTVGEYILVDSEAMLITAIDTGTNVLTVTRAQLGTVAATHSTAADIYWALPLVSRVSNVDFSGSASQLTFAPANAIAVASGDAYEVHYKFHPLQIRDKLNEILENLRRPILLPLTLVTDGDMEATGTTNWTASGTGGTPTLAKDTTTVLRGRKTLSVTNDGSTTRGFAKSASVFLRPSSEVFVSADVYVTSGDSAKLTLRRITATAADIETAETAATGWVHLEFTATIPAGCEEVQVWLESPAASDVTYWGSVQLLPTLRSTYTYPSSLEWGEDLDKVFYFPRGAAFTATTDDNAYDILEGPARHWSHFEKLQDDTAVVPFRLELAKTNVDQALYVKGYVDYDVLYIDTQTTPAPDDIVVDLVYAALLDDWAQEDRDTGRLDDAKSKEEKANNVRIKLTPRMLQWAKPRGRLVGVFKA